MAPEARPNQGEIPNSGILAISQEVFDLYSSRFRGAMKVPVTVVMPSSPEVSVFKHDGFDLNIPISGYFISPVVGISPDRKKVNGVRGFLNPRIYLLKGDANLVSASNPERAYGHILSRAIIHSQTTPRDIAGATDPILKSSDLKTLRKIAYVTGFRAVEVDPANGRGKEITKTFDDAVAQLISMHLLGALDTEDQVIEEMKSHGRGIAKDDILTAEVLNKYFKKLRISIEEVERFHYESDLKGLISRVRTADPTLVPSFIEIITAER